MEEIGGASAIGSRIRRLRLARGLSKHEIAKRLHVDISVPSAWEAGRYRPSEAHRMALAELLETDFSQLFSPEADREFSETDASLVDTVEELPSLLLAFLNKARCLKALRLAAPYSTATHVQTVFRARVAERLKARTLEVLRIEIFYDLARLRETLSNILRYDGLSYHVKTFCAGLREVSPAFGAYIFDEEPILVGAYWTGVPPHGKPGLKLTGAAPSAFFAQYWQEIWGRGTNLNLRGAHDLSAVRDVALKLGLAEKDWPGFVEDARSLDIGDGAPPLI